MFIVESKRYRHHRLGYAIYMIAIILLGLSGIASVLTMHLRVPPKIHR